jgi:hypothetical protein
VVWGGRPRPPLLKWILDNSDVSPFDREIQKRRVKAPAPHPNKKRQDRPPAVSIEHSG